MKILLFLVIFLPIASLSQDSTIAKSKFEEFSSRTGVMTKTEIFETGSVKDCKFSVVKVTDIATGVSVKSLSITQNIKGFFVTMTSGSLYIDWEELSGFIAALKFQKEQLDSKPEVQTTYGYSTINGIVASASYYPSGAMTGWYLALGMVYKYSRASVPGSAIVFKKKDMEDVISFLEKAEKTNF